VSGALLALPFGLAVGLLLGLFGGGGSILAVPVLVYVLGQPVKAATTESLLIVGTAALVGAAAYARSGRVQIRTGLAFGAAGAAGAIAGTALNRLVSGRALLLAFALLLLAAAAAMLRRRPDLPEPGGKLSFVRVAPAGVATGVLTGFFGVGGGFVIVPALVLLLGLPITLAVGTSLLVIALTSGAALASHLASGSIDWTIALAFSGAAIAGAIAGRRLSATVSAESLGQLFALLLVAIAVFLVAENAAAAVSARLVSKGSLDDGAQALFHSGGDGRKLIVADDREHPLRVDRGDPGLAVPLVDDHVAGQQNAELGFGLQRPVGEWWVAGAEDQVRLAVDAEFLPQRRLHVDLAQHAESRRRELGSDALDGLSKREQRRAAQCVTSGEHPHSSSR
jgi:uncharacterized membrane protein YfcA